MSEDDIDALDPEALLVLLRDTNANPVDLTLGAELARRLAESTGVVPVLLALTKHQHARVREGAVLGLAHFRGRNDVLGRLTALADEDPSPAVRKTAESVVTHLRELDGQG